MKTNRGGFYWVLARHHLPNMWWYFSACVAAQKSRGDDTMDLGGSVLVRAVRALQARDAIGQQFHVPQDRDTEDQIMYHFDFLTVVLSGALEAQAKIANRAYGIGFSENYASFRNSGFIAKLGANKDAQTLYAVTSRQDFADLSALLYELRRTIHGAALQTLQHTPGASSDPVVFVRIPASISRIIWDAAGRRGSAERWGLLARGSDVWMEPYSYASALAEDGLRAIDAVAGHTNVTLLFPQGHSTQSWLTGPPNDEVFGEANRKRVALLG